jgi:hypothetical protein
MTNEDQGALGLTNSMAERKRGVTGGISSGSGQSVEGLGLSEEEGGTSFVKESEEESCMERLQEGSTPVRRCGGLGVTVGGSGLSVEKEKEVNGRVNGLGCKGAMESGPSSEPIRVQTFQSKEAKPKMKRVLISEGTSSTEELPGPNVDRATGQNMEGISPELTQTESPVIQRSGFVGQESDGKPGEGCSPREEIAITDEPVSGQNREGTTPELAQSESPVTQRSGLVGEESDDNPGKGCSPREEKVGTEEPVSGKNRESTTPELAQIVTQGTDRTGYVRQVHDGALGKVLPLSPVTGGGLCQWYRSWAMCQMC